ncbi:sodium:solute symporter family protein [Candidatus Peregrinibacteria bacterium]|jgi:solute:Na+ symporter, SSS family|nr:sodium:solute symporter family protein [Candidatus Peregrinibacteria bacterium]
MQSSLSHLDLVLIGAYILLCLFIGWKSSRNESTEGFLLGDRKLGTFENIATMLASKTGGGMFLTAVTFMYLYGGAILWAYVGIGVGYLIFVKIGTTLRRLSEEKKYYTLSDYYFDKFDNVAGYTTAFAILIGLMMGLIIQLTGGAMIMSQLMGWSFEAALIITSVTILIYITLGGFKAVVKTDIAQFFALIVLSTFIGFVLINGMEMSYGEFEFTALPVKTLIGFFLFGILYPFASAELWQRIYAGKSVKSIQKTIVASAFIYVLLGIPFMMMGLGIKAKLPPTNSEVALIEGFLQLLPSGIMGIGLVAIFAAIMSSADTALFTMTSVVLQDFYDRIRKTTGRVVSKGNLVKLFRVWLGIFMIVGFSLSLFLRSINDAALIFTGFVPVTALTVLFSWIWKCMPGYFFTLMIGFGYAGSIYAIFTIGITEQLILSGLEGALVGFGVGLLIHGWVKIRT